MMQLKRLPRLTSALRWLFAIGLIGLAGCGKTPPRGPKPIAENVAKIRASVVSNTTEKTGMGGMAAATPTGTAWATLSGAFQLVGDPPQPAVVNITKEPGVCAPGGAKVYSQTLLVDKSTKGIANVLIFARRTARVHESAQAPPKQMAVFDQKDCVFLSRVFVAQVGQLVSLKNSDPSPHNVQITPPRNPALNQLIPGHSSFDDYKFTSEETAPVAATCAIHEWMKAYMFTRKNAYVAVTKADGSFEIPNLPDGEEIEFQVWHERAEQMSLDAAAPKISKGRFKIKLTADENRKLKLDVPVAAFAPE